jgi:hypothetical protein
MSVQFVPYLNQDFEKLKSKHLKENRLFVDDKLVDTSKIHAYKGVMFSEIPNFAIAIGAFCNLG